ncbi:DUF6153 family protein [Marinactinospora rubrisoli]|uniref:DUF6153 family protein n=1 Tax=Marinactinospora rubrisoli TaxID=2715399 RepID=A0ABW2KCF0_9ACTN
MTFPVRTRRRAAPGMWENWTPRAWAHALLLLCVLTGLAGMHTLGHLHSGEHPAPETSASAPADGAAHGAMDGAADSGMGAMAGSPVDGDGHDAPPPLDPTSVCLAIGGLVVVLLGLAAGAFPRWPGTVVRTRAQGRRHRPSGAPPPRPPTLSLLQVLRI